MENKIFIKKKIEKNICRTFVVLLFVFVSSIVNGQNQNRKDTSIAVIDTIYDPGNPKGFSAKWKMKPHSPLKATIFSAALPGLGQMYNGKWWKSGIVYAGLGTCIYFIADNTRNYRDYRSSYVALVDGDPLTIPSKSGDADFLNRSQDQFRRWLDVSYMALIGVYVLNIIDANIDGHLFYYDVSPKIQLHLQPSLMFSERVNSGFRLALTF